MKNMEPRLRKFALTAHVTSSVGWLGAVAVSLALAVACLSTRDPELVRAAYLTMKLIGWVVLVPLSLASLLTGLIQSLGTQWGLFRHYWVLVKLLLTVFAATVLLLKIELIDDAARLATEMALPHADLREAGIQLAVHAAGGLLLLIVPVVLSIYKPPGMTRYGWRKQFGQYS